jgi:coenzyme F420 hydrogenase subunit beta
MGANAHSPPDARTRRVSERYHRLLVGSDDANEWAYAWRSEVNRGGFRAVDFLMDEVVDAGTCVGCASCVTICPVDVFDYVDERPSDARTAACVQCVLCAEVCPVLRPQDKDLASVVDYREPRSDDGYGPYSYAVYARATSPDIRDRAQDGGVVSALLVHALETRAINGAILGDVLPGDKLSGTHKLALTSKEIVSCAGSRYTYSPNTLAFREAIRRDVKPVAVVGVPCQVDGVRLEQNAGVRSAMSSWYRSHVALTIGLFCSESFTHASIEKLARMIDAEPERIEHVNIKGKVVVRLDDGSVVNASLTRYRAFARPACLYCRDYAAEHADIGMGGIGLDGWTYVLVRTEIGHRFLQAAIDAGCIATRSISDDPRGELLLSQLSAEKKRNRPHPALMPTLRARAELGCLDPKTYYTSGPGARHAAEEEGG